MIDKRIPNKLFFKIGEVCELTETQPYVLRYWESEFQALAPAKNSSGQRIYRRRDIETVLRIKELLYDEGFTIAGAKKRLESELSGRPETPQLAGAAAAAGDDVDLAALGERIAQRLDAGRVHAVVVGHEDERLSHRQQRPRPR